MLDARSSGSQDRRTFLALTSESRGSGFPCWSQKSVVIRLGARWEGVFSCEAEVAPLFWVKVIVWVPLFVFNAMVEVHVISD